MKEFVFRHFDKLLLTFFVLYFSALGFHSVYVLELHKTDVSNPIIQAFMAAMLDNQKLVIGALLGLITGRAMATVKNGNGNGNTTTPPKGEGQ